MVNDVSALTAPGALETVAASEAAVCLMHMQGEPGTMQAAPHYRDVVVEVREYLRSRVTACLAAGIARERLAVDPGFGFGKAIDHNLALLSGLRAIAGDGVPVLAGLSRKRMIGALTGRAEGDRLAQSLGAPAGAWVTAAKGWQQRIMSTPALSLQFGEDVEAAKRG